MSLSREDRRQAILDAASEVIFELGPAKTTLEDIARRSGMAKTSLYYYFRDKNEIIRELIRRDMENLHSEMLSAVNAHESAEARMAALVQARYLFITERAKKASREIQEEFRSLAGIFQHERDRYLQIHREIVEDILREGIEKGELRHVDDLELVSLIIISSMFGCDRTFAHYGQHERVMEGMRNMVGIFFKGLRAGSETSS